MKTIVPTILMLFLSVNVFAHDVKSEVDEKETDVAELAYGADLDADELDVSVLVKKVDELITQTNTNTKNIGSLSKNQQNLLARVEALEGKKVKASGNLGNDGRPNPCGLGVRSNNDPIIAIDGVPVNSGFFNYPQLGSGYVAYGNNQQVQPGGCWGTSRTRSNYKTRSNFVYRAPPTPTLSMPQINLGSVGNANVSYRTKVRVSSGTGWFPGKLLGKSLGRVVAPVAVRRRQVSTSRCPGGVCPY